MKSLSSQNTFGVSGVNSAIDSTDLAIESDAAATRFGTRFCMIDWLQILKRVGTI